MVETTIQTFGGNVGIGTKDPGSNKLKVVGGTSVGALTVGSLQVLSNVSAHVPSGLIIMWYGAYNAIPTGWKLCDGTNSTPDLRSNLIMGWGTTYASGTKGGSVNYAFAAQEIAAHNHNTQVSQGGDHTHPNVAAPHSHNLSTDGAPHIMFGNHVHNFSADTHTHNTDTYNHTHRNWIVDTRASATGQLYYNVNSTSGSWVNHGNISDSAVRNIGTRSGGSHAHQMTNSANHVHNSNNTGSDHNHSFAGQTATNHTHSLIEAAAIQHTHNFNNSGNHTHNITIGNTGNGASFSILPPYHALVFIMKI